MSDVVMHAEDVHKSFGRLEVLKGISLEVEKGETVCVIGPSGSGKTTFIRCINHLEKIDSVDRGQMEAAKSIGMTYGLAMRRIILPQAARVIVPPLGNEFNAMIKNTSLVFTIGVYEMFSDAEIHYSQTFQPVEFFGAVAIWYLVLTSVWTVIQAAIERKLAASERADELTLWERIVESWTPVQAWARGAR